MLWYQLALFILNVNVILLMPNPKLHSALSANVYKIIIAPNYQK